MHYVLPWRPQDPCPCGSGIALESCCLDADQTPRIKIPSLVPPGPLTEYEHPKCYLRHTKNCCDKISNEHYISKAILEIVGEIEIDGLPWLVPGEKAKYGINGLASKILCKRHNSSLSPLDTLAANAFSIIREACTDLSRKSLSRKKHWHLASGTALELWAIKTLCGIFYSAIAAKDRAPLLESHALDIQRFDDALRYGLQTDGCGLYVRIQQGVSNRHVAVSALSVETSNKVIGIRIGIYAIEFEVIFDPTNVNFDYVRQHNFYRPWLLNLANGLRKHSVLLSWPGAAVGQSADFEMRAPSKVDIAQVERLPQRWH